MQAQLLQNEGAVKWLSMGALLRQRLSGEQRQEMNEGQLVDNATTYQILEKEINGLPLEPPILIDGFPRNVEQVDWLEDFIERSPRILRKVVVIQLDRDEIMTRLTKRGREDDTEEVIEERLRIYHDIVEPVIERFVSDHAPLVEINGQGTVEEVHKRILEAI